MCHIIKGGDVRLEPEVISIDFANLSNRDAEAFDHGFIFTLHHQKPIINGD
jgi:hypothetical protein